ncbi:MAG: DUF4263 domain-containing protein [Candidatus Omnitrophica bacterium]|nr:DUF4263 domain-containing protein [Candidatus Omnitrophota bacterium]
MSKKKGLAKEILKSNLRNKKVYYYVDSESGIKIKSREVFKTSSKTIQFPFWPNDGKPKYPSIRKVICEGLPEPLPRGFYKSYTKGYGFTREFNPIIYYLNNSFPQITTVIVSKSAKSRFVDNRKVIFNLKDFENAIPQVAFMLGNHREQKDCLANDILSKMFPGKFTAKATKYQKGQLNAFISQHSLKPDELSSEDVRSISSLFASLPSTHEFIKKKGILSTKESVDRIFIEDILQRFNDLYSQKTESQTLENKWQEFFKDNILYFNFGYVDFFEKSRIQGDISTEIPDFTILNIYGYLDVFEIKTHLTKLLSFDSQRKNFYWTSEASRAISQAENYIDAITKEELKICKNILDEYSYNINAVRPKVYIIASSRDKLAGSKTLKYQGKLKRKLNNDFRRLNNSLKNITFILYDELLEVFQNTLKRLQLKNAE